MVHARYGGYLVSLTRLTACATVPEWIPEVQRFLIQANETTALEEIGRAIDQFREANLTITVLGKAKRGKSTLLNALLGRSDDLIAPVDRLPASNAVTRFRWSEQETASVVFREGRHLPITFSRVREYVTEELNRNNHKQVDVVCVSGPFVGIAPHTELIDTPGAGSIHEHHDALLHAFIPQSDIVIMLVTARMPLDQEELDLLKQIQATDIQKIFFVINRIDEVSEQELQQATQHNQSLLLKNGLPVEKIHHISAKRAFQGNLEYSGVPELIQEIRQFLGVYRGQTLRDRLQSRIRIAVTPVIERLELSRITATRSDVEIESESKRLLSKQAELESQREFSSQEFKLAWNRAVDEFDLALQESLPVLRAALREQISNSSILQGNKTGSQLTGLANRLLEQQLSVAALSFEQKLRQATDHLQATFPHFTISPHGGIEFGSPGRESAQFLVTSLGGVAVASTGMGLAAAGSAAATTIAAANAAAVAATSTVAVPTALGGILSSVPYLGGMLTQLATGTATLSTPIALTTTPLWVALSGPVGWTLAGVGALAIPLAWRSSHLKARQQIQDACQQQIEHVVSQLRTDRLSIVRKMSTAIVEEFQLRLDRQIHDLKGLLQEQREQRPNHARLALIAETVAGLRRYFPTQ